MIFSTVSEEKLHILQAEECIPIGHISYHECSTVVLALFDSININRIATIMLIFIMRTSLCHKVVILDLELFSE